MRVQNDTFLKRYYPMEDGEELQVTLTFSEGGINYWNYEMEQKGIYMHFRPVRRERSEDFTSINYSMADDRAKKILVQEMHRRNKKTGRDLATHYGGRLDELAAFAIAQNWQAIWDKVKEGE